MKTILYILTATLFFSSCRSINKMVESGNYDQALRYGVDKLRGKKKKKTDHVKGLEEAYAKLNAHNVRNIKQLEAANTLRSMNDIISIYNTLIKRQEYIAPLLPLYSQDGYYANIAIIDYSNDIKHQVGRINHKKIAITESKYNQALKLVELARTGSKTNARKAMRRLMLTEKYFGHYKDTPKLKREVTKIGITRILVEPYAAGSNIAFQHSMDIISIINTGKLNSYWNKFYTNGDNVDIDYIATMEIAEILPGREKERYNTYTETKEIIDGKQPVKDNDGNVVKDTSGNIIYTDKLKSVTAYLEEIERNKVARMNGKIIVINTTNNNHVNTIPISVQNIFDDYSCRFRGDKRALADLTSKRLRDICAPFPTDYAMTTALANSYKKAAESILSKHKFI